MPAVALRDFFQVYSHEANDLGQWLFALHVAGAVTAATRAGTHLGVDSLAKRYPIWLRRRVARVCDLAALGPWALFVLVSGTPMIASSIGHRERFPDTGNPGYFIIKASLWLMVGAVLASIALGLLRAGAGDKV